ncbi:SusC/RagA family TonB-linked outer membrane protein [Mucilaginibacter mallensis]|nr:SusC/RagA family TonB-linked outer membrane protein [Mucilaginibacter mallensis]
MKLTTLLITLTILQVSAATYAQKITLSEKNASLITVFDDIKSQTGYDFMISMGVLRSANTVTINVKNIPLQEVLKQIFQNQPLTYEVADKSILVKQKDPPLLTNVKDKVATLLALPADVNGRVVDSLGQPVIGANVSLSINGMSYGIATDNKGDFHFNKVPQGRYTLLVTYIGYSKLEKIVKVDGKDLTLNLVMRNSTSALDQIQVIAYGTESRRFSVGSVSTVTAEDIEKQPVTNPLLALQGHAPGLAITSTGGIPGSQVTVQIRGQNTLLSNSLTNTTNLKPYDQPLFIIDGVPFATKNVNINQLSTLVTTSNFTGGSSNQTQGGFSPFNNINPADIESISILKDADATSIYGSEGSNGVIIITTKKGKAGPTAFDLNVNTGFNSAADAVQMMNTQQYLQFRNDAFAANGVTPSNNPNNFSAYAPDLTIFDQSKYTNWEKVIYGKTTSNTDVHGSLSGGTANNTFMMSAGYNKSTYNYPGNFADQRFTFHSNLHHISTDKRLAIDMITDFGYDQNNSASSGGGKDIVLPPNLPSLLSPSGGLIWNYKGVDLTSDQFYSGLQQPTTLQNYNFNYAFHISYKIWDGLSIGADLGYNRNSTNEHNINPLSAQNPALSNSIATATFTNSINETINIEPQIKYNKTFGKGVFSALVGSTYKKQPSYSTQLTGSGYPNINFLGSIDGATTISAFDASSIYKYSAGFARINYIYNSEFIFELTGRRDGSSYFGPGKQFGNFGSGAAGWIFTEEKIFKNAPSILSYGKLSGSYGTSGGNAGQAYQYNTLYQTIQYVPSFQGSTPTTPYNAYNPDYSWGVKKSLNIALDLGLFNNRLLLNATFYRDRESNQLVNYPLPIQTGFSSVLGNLDATVQNQGFEFSIISTNIKTKDFSWKTNFNLSFNRNKLISFPNLANSSYSEQYVIGQPTSIIYGYKYKDVNPTTGLFEFYKADGKTVTSNPTAGVASVGGDQVPIANQEVKYMGGFGNNFSYKQFSLYIFCQFSSQNAPSYLSQLYSNYPNGFEFNQPTAVLNNYWKAPGDVAQLQKLANGYSSSAFLTGLKFDQSSGVYTDDTYLRVKTVSLAYQLPDAFLKKIHVKGGSVFMNGQNLLTFTDYKVGDPELPGTYTSFPIQRILAFGLNLKF